MKHGRVLILVVSVLLIPTGCEQQTQNNNIPLVKNVIYTTTVNTAVRGKLSATDKDQDPLIFSIVSPPALGRVQITDAENGYFLYQPKSGYTGEDVFTYGVNDGTADSKVANLKIVINESEQQAVLPNPPQSLISPSTANTPISDITSADTGSAPTVIALALAPGDVDLQITSASISPGLTVSSGDSISVSLSLINNGTAASDTTNPNAQGFHVGFDLIRENTTNGLRYTDDKILIGNLGPGQTSTQTVAFRIPRPFWLDGDGQYFLKVIVDSSNSVLETVESNNELVISATPINVTINSNRDISINPLGITQAAVALGDALSIDNTVMHSNMSGSSSHQVSFWLAEDEAAFSNGTAQLIGLRSVNQSGGMGGGGHHAASSVIVPSFVPPGTYLVGAIADHFKRHNETNTQNNSTLTISSIQVVRGPRSGPDLVLDNFSLPAATTNVNHGEFFPVDIAISNQGDIPSFSNNVGFADGIPLSIQATDSNGTSFTLLFEVLPNLIVGESITLTRWIAFQNTSLFTAGAYTLSATVDPTTPVDNSTSGKHLESNETNNQSSLALNLGIAATADLVALNTVNGQSQAGIGQTVNYSYTVNNIGSTDVSSFKVKLSMKLQGSDTAWNLGSRTIPWLPAGGASTETLLLSVPQVQLSSAFTSNPSTLEVIASADASNNQFEIVENNNTATAAQLGVFSDADLALSAATLADSQITLPGSSTYTVTASNLGSTAVEANSTIRVSLSADGVSEDYIIGIISIPELAGGASLSQSIPVSLDVGITAGIYSVIATGETTWDANNANDTANALSLTVIEPAPAP